MDDEITQKRQETRNRGKIIKNKTKGEKDAPREGPDTFSRK